MTRGGPCIVQAIVHASRHSDVIRQSVLLPETGGAIRGIIGPAELLQYDSRGHGEI